MKRGFISKKNFLYLLVFPVSFSSLSLNGAMIKSTGGSFPDVSVPENCDSSEGQCKIYNGSESLDILSSNKADSTNSTFEQSFGYDTVSGGTGNNNTVIIKSGGDITGIIRGMSSENNGDGASFQDNTVYIDLNGGKLLLDRAGLTHGGGGISGASAKYGQALLGNNVFIKNSILNTENSIYGAYANAASTYSFSKSEINNNSVMIDSSQLTGGADSYFSTVFAGAGLYMVRNPFESSATSDSVDMSGNSLYVRNSRVAFDAMAGSFVYSISGAKKFTSHNNTVYVENSILDSGDAAFNRIYAAVGKDVHENALIIDGSELNLTTDNKSYDISAAYYSGDLADNNKVIINSSTINTLSDGSPDAKGVIITGGYSQNIATNNSVSMSNVTLGKKVTGIIGGRSAAADVNGVADNNSVVLNNVDMHDELSIHGGYITSKITKDIISASGNSVLIENSLLAGNLYGGKLGSTSSPIAGKAENNIITLGAGLSGAFNVLYGGFGADHTTTYRGNTLNLHSNISTGELGGFQHYNFYYRDLSQLDTAMIQVTGGQSVPLYTTRASTDNSTITVMTKGLDVKDGTKFQLINSVNGFTDADTGISLTQGDLDKIGAGTAPEIANFRSLATVERFTHLEDYHLEIADNTISAVLGKTDSDDKPQPDPDDKPQPDPDDKPQPNPDDKPDPKPTVKNDQTDILSAVPLAALASLVTSGDLIVDTALSGSANRSGGPFVAASYGDYGYDTGNNLKTKQTSVVLGFGFYTPVAEYGVFLETGHNRYDAHTGSSFGDVSLSGNHSYGGAGLYLDYATPVNGLHTTAYVKGGAMYDDFGSYIAMTDVDISESSAYWGAHAGFYWDAPVSSTWNGRVFARYFYDGREKTQSRIDDSEVHFGQLNSHRIETGILATYTGSNNFRPFVGISWQEMFNTGPHNRISDSVNSWDLDSANMNGGSAVLTAGVSYLDDKKDLEMGINFDGYSGIRTGAAAQVQFKWHF
ncbi:hypothetical protein ACSG67_004488 [Salmonella enterica subsp. enterica serovar Muenchen]